MEKEIYADYSATTYVKKEIIQEMLPYFDKFYGNPSSIHFKGVEAKKTYNNCKEKISKIINCKSNEIYFTSSRK